MLVFSVLVLAYIMRVLEYPLMFIKNLPYQQTLSNYTEAVWLVLMTMTSVGYGDIYPETIGGKIVAAFTALWGTFMVSMFILVQSSILGLTG